jgi:hypothetical protein
MPNIADAVKKRSQVTGAALSAGVPQVLATKETAESSRWKADEPGPPDFMLRLRQKLESENGLDDIGAALAGWSVVPMLSQNRGKLRW